MLLNAQQSTISCEHILYVVCDVHVNEWDENLQLLILLEIRKADPSDRFVSLSVTLEVQ